MNMPRIRRSRATVGSIILAVCVTVGLGYQIAAQGKLTFAATTARSSPPPWIAAWGTTLQYGQIFPGANFTCRFIARPTIAGQRLRLRLSNSVGPAPVTFDAVTVGLRQGGAAVVPGSNHQVTFRGHARVTIKAGSAVESDPVDLPAQAQEDLAISVYVAGDHPGVARHDIALATSYCTTGDGTGGNHAADSGGAAFTATRTDTLWLTGVDVQGTTARGAVVVLGDSLADGYQATNNAYDRWPDVLARRLMDYSVINANVSGNAIINTCCQPTAFQRLDGDVLAIPGIRAIILCEGSNDVVNGSSASAVEGGMLAIILRAHAKGIRVIGTTLTPRASVGVPERTRQAVNTWIRTSHFFDGVVDFDAIVRDPHAPNMYLPTFDSGDHGHPNPAGYAALGNAVDLTLFG